MAITRRQVYSALAGVGILIGTAGIASATSGNGAPSASSSPAASDDTSTPDPTDGDGAVDGNEATEQGDANDNEAADDNDGGNEGNVGTPAYASSITIADSGEGTSGAEESAALTAVATITSDDASSAAVAANPGTVRKVELENENGNVVYSVEIDTGSGIVDVKVDAGNARILGTESDDGKAHDGHDVNDKNEAPGTEEADD